MGRGGGKTTSSHTRAECLVVHDATGWRPSAGRAGMDSLHTFTRSVSPSGSIDDRPGPDDCYHRVAASLGRTRDALDVLDGFRTRFSPEDILIPSRSSHRKQAKKTRIRLSSASTTLEDAVPPHILFHDISILHQRLVRDGDLKGIGALKWTCLSYQKALETRRSRRLRK